MEQLQKTYKKNGRSINDFKASAIMVTPSYMLNIIEEMENMGINPKETALKVGIFDVEP